MRRGLPPAVAGFSTTRAKYHDGDSGYDLERAAEDDDAYKYDKARGRRRRATREWVRLRTRSTYIKIACALVVLYLVFRPAPSDTFSSSSTAVLDAEELQLGPRTGGDRLAEVPRAGVSSPRILPTTVTSQVKTQKHENGDVLARNASSGSKLVPRLVHQTYKSRSALTERDAALMKTWSDMNPGWEMRFYDDEDCKRFVNEHFPEYYQAYASLEKKVEQSDFFRYLVVLKLGGVYADIDTECRQPLDDFIHAKDTLIVGWENEFFTDSQAYSRHFVRRRQVLNWAFAGAPGHPVLIAVANHINAGAQKIFTKSTNRNTLERTGPGAFTDALMDHFQKLREGQANTFWNVRMLPKVNFGTHPLGEEGVSQDHPDVVIAHRYSGGWKDKSGWNGKRKWYEHMAILFHSLKSDLPEYREKIASRDEHFQMPTVDSEKMYPVNALWKPSFDLLTPLVGTLEDEVTTAEGYWLTLYGRPKLATLSPLRAGETPADMLLVGLNRRAATGGANNKAIFVDVGAGFGYYTIAMASQAHDVYAYEWQDAMVKNMQAAVDYNGLGKNVQVMTEHSSIERGDELTALAERVGKVDGLRISGRGINGALLDGAKSLLSSPLHPGVVLLELNAKLLASSGYSTERFIELFEFMWNAGYTDIGHAGPSCDGRGVRSLKSQQQSAFDSKAWCRIDVSSIGRVVSAMDDNELEAIVFFHNGAASI